MRDRRRLLEEERETGETDAMKLVRVAELVDLGAPLMTSGGEQHWVEPLKIGSSFSPVRRWAGPCFWARLFDLFSYFVSFTVQIVVLFLFRFLIV